MPVYDVSATAEALDIDQKRLDNIISRNTIPGVEHRHRGVTRRLTPEAVVVIRVALELVHLLKLPVAQAIETATAVAQGDSASVPLGRFVTLEVDIQAVRTSTLTRLDEAVESVGRRPRGRPAVRKGSGPRALAG